MATHAGLGLYGILIRPAKRFKKAWIVDCFLPTKGVFREFRTVPPVVPDIPGMYNVTISAEEVREPAVFEFEVLGIILP